MSEIVAAAVMQSSLRGLEKFVARVLADQANHRGEGISISYSQIATLCGITRRTAIRLIKSLETAGIVSGHGASDAPRRYQIHPDKLPHERPVEVLTTATVSPASDTVSPASDTVSLATPPQLVTQSHQLVTQSHHLESDSMNQDSNNENLPKRRNADQDISTAFWSLFQETHQTIFGAPYAGTMIAPQQSPAIATLIRLPRPEQVEIIQAALTAIRNTGGDTISPYAAWTTYEPALAEAIKQQAQRLNDAQTIATFVANLNEALARLRLAPFVGTSLKPEQKMAIVGFGPELNADVLEQSIQKYIDLHCRNGEPFLITTRLMWVITTAKNARLAQNSGKGKKPYDTHQRNGYRRSNGVAPKDAFVELANQLGQL